MNEDAHLMRGEEGPLTAGARLLSVCHSESIHLLLSVRVALLLLSSWCTALHSLLCAYYYASFAGSQSKNVSTENGIIYYRTF